MTIKNKYTFAIFSIFTLFFSSIGIANAQDINNAGTVTRSTKRTTPSTRKKQTDNINKELKLSNRAQIFSEISQSNSKNASWSRVVYRKLDLDKEENAVLYYPEYPSIAKRNLFANIFELLRTSQISAYEYLDGTEFYDEEHELKFVDFLEKYNIPYKKGPKNSLSIEVADIPSNQVKAYYIKENNYFDLNTSSFNIEIEAICPIMYDLSDYGDTLSMPLFWIKYSDLKPYISEEYVMISSNNNVENYTLSDYFDLNIYKGDIVKTLNLRGKSLMQITNNSDSLKLIQNKIEREIKNAEYILDESCIKEVSKNEASLTDKQKDISDKRNSRDKRVSSSKKDVPKETKPTTTKSSRSVRRSR